MRASFARLLLNRYFPAAAFASILMCIGVLTRVALWLHPGTAVPATAPALAHVFGLGALFDLANAAFFCAPLVLYLSLVPDRVARWSIQRLLFTGLFGCGIYLLCLVALSEWVFWDEFGTRFNLIAVDYLVYSREVLSQIDIAPTLLGLLHAHYDSKFFGADVRAPGPAPGRAFLATDQTLGYIRDAMVVTLSPRRAVHIRPLEPGGPRPSPARERELEEEAIAFYQIASKEFRSGAYRLARQRSAPT